MALQIPTGGSSLFKQGYAMHSGIEEAVIRFAFLISRFFEQFVQTGKLMMMVMIGIFMQ